MEELRGNAPDRHAWHAHVEEEEARRGARQEEEIENVYRFAEELAERSMRGVDATSNEYQRAEERGEKHGIGQVAPEIADAGDLAGG
jgi:hypothetical protein